MSDDTATSAIQRDTIRMYSARQSAALLSGLLDRFIPNACRREAHDALMDAFFSEGMELVSIQQRLEIEQIRKTLLEGASFRLGDRLIDPVPPPTDKP